MDRTRVLRLLRGVESSLDFLSVEASATPERRADPLWLPGVKYLLQTAIEACVDVAQHLCATQRWGPPNDNGDAMRLLGQHKVLNPELASRMRMAVGFRNVLVHEYVDVDEEIVLARVIDHGDLRSYVTSVIRWLDEE